MQKSLIVSEVHQTQVSPSSWRKGKGSVEKADFFLMSLGLGLVSTTSALVWKSVFGSSIHGAWVAIRLYNQHQGLNFSEQLTSRLGPFPHHWNMTADTHELKEERFIMFQPMVH